MAKQTLLEIVQDILNDMDGDEVSSITDTTESLQIANIVRSTFNEIVDSRDWPHLKQLATLVPSITYPTVFNVTDTFRTIDWIKYNKRKVSDVRDKYDAILYLTPEEFMNYCDSRSSSATNVTTVVINNIKYNIKTDTAPTYWTTFDDETIIMDSYDSDVDSNLQASKTQCFASLLPVFTMSDTYVPDLPAKAFSYLVAEAKSTASYSLRQVGNQKEEQKSQRQRKWLAREKWRLNGGMSFPNYGRK